MQDFIAKLQKEGIEFKRDPETIKHYSRDASIFEMQPYLVVFPKNAHDVQTIVNLARFEKKKTPDLSLTPRAAGTCMSGGSLTQSVMISVEKMEKILEIGRDFAIVEPGMFYRDFEREIGEHDLMYPAYPSSRLLCRVGGMVANNAGGEKSLKYGKAEDFVEELEVVLSDGRTYTFKKLTKSEFEKKRKQKTFEGELYRRIYKLIEDNETLIIKSKPKVSKNSSGYIIWRVWDGEHFDMTKLFVGSQGTLGIITKIKFKLLLKIKHHGLLIVSLNNFDHLPEIVKVVLTHNPDSFETYDSETLNLALKYYYGFAHKLHTNFFGVTRLFFHQLLDKIEGKSPRLVLLVEYEGEQLTDIHQNLNNLANELRQFENITKIEVTHNQRERDMYWLVRRESFNLLRQRVRGMYAAPFIDDTCVNPDVLPEFFPKIYKILEEERVHTTIAGHIGNGNLHIIPLMDLSREEEREKIYKVNERVFKLVKEYGGSISGEHNDGLIRAPYLEMQYGSEMYKVFERIKEIFDPEGLFNPKKKIGVTELYAKRFLITTKASS